MVRGRGAGVRICFFNRSYWPDLGATGQLLTELAEDLVRDYGYAVSVVAGLPLLNRQATRSLVRAWLPVRREAHHGVQIVRAAGTTFPPRRFAGRVSNYLSYFLSACLAGLTVPRPDVVVALTDPPIIGLAALLTARRWGARLVFWCQDVFPEVTWLLEDFQHATVNRLLEHINRRLVRQADRVVALGDTMRQRLIVGKGAEPQKVEVIHNWADCEAIVPGAKDNAFARAHGLAERFVVMHSGNMGLSQHLDTLLDAASLLRPYADLVVALVGDGTTRPVLEARARAQGLSNVRFLPYQPRESLRESFASADVFVIALKRGLAGYIVPSKLYGILAAGRPYVAAVEDACEVAAMTTQSDCGLLAEPGDPKDLAEQILTLYHDRPLAQRLGAHARQAALLFDRRRQVQAYHELFRTLVE
jgi:putative colanic acid biosynthesis glycosyltransferase WcaI